MNKKRSLNISVALYNAKQIKQIEQEYAAGSTQGTYPLMEKAGAALFKQLLLEWPHTKNIIVVTGKGNNAGDGFVVARLAAESRIKVTVCPLSETKLLTGDALRAYQKVPHRNIKYLNLEQVDFSASDIIVDAILGTGIKGKLSEDYLIAIKKINASPSPVVAVDIPTGVEADTGFVHNDAIKADLTVSFIGRKKGMYTGDAAKFCGRVSLESLDISQKFYDRQEFHLFTHTWQSIKHHLKARDVTSHKGHFGHTTIIGGQQGMAGAAILSATAAARSGSGWTSAWVDKDCVGPLISRIPEVMAQSIPETEIKDKLCSELISLPYLGHTFVVGPGLGKTSWGRRWITELSECEFTRGCRQVWDADALNLLAEFSDSATNRFNSDRVLTPHPGEAARLLKSSTHSISQDRFNAAQSIAKRYGGVCVLKGNGTIIADDKGFQVVCPVGNPGMASGGMGDVLAGLIGGLLAQGHSLMDAAILGVCIHGEAADKAAGRGKFYRGMLASDLFKYFPALLNG